MKTLIEYIEESLLDNIDDLELNSDDNVSKSLSIGSEWEISSTDDFCVVDKIDKSKLKKYPAIWDQTKFRAIRGYSSRSSSPKPNKTEQLIGNIFLSLDKNALVYDNNSYKPGNIIYDFFQDLMQKHFDALYKSDLHFNPQVEKRKVSIFIDGASNKHVFYISVLIGGGYSFEITLKKKE